MEKAFPASGSALRMEVPVNWSCLLLLPVSSSWIQTVFAPSLWMTLSEKVKAPSGRLVETG